MRLCQTAPMGAAGSENPTNLADRRCAPPRPAAPTPPRSCTCRPTATGPPSPGPSWTPTSTPPRPACAAEPGPARRRPGRAGPGEHAGLRHAVLRGAARRAGRRADQHRLHRAGDAPGCSARPTRRSCSATTRRCRSSRRRSPAPTGCIVDPAGLDSIIAAGRRAGAAASRTRGGEDLAVLLFTSGTSGRPKGGDAQPPRAARQPRPVPGPRARRRCGQDDVVLLVLPLFHIYGLNAGLGMVAAHRRDRRARRAVRPGADRWSWSGRGRDEHPGRPADVRRLGAARRRSSDALRERAAARLRRLPAAAARCSSRCAPSVGRPIYEGYGLTETAPVRQQHAGLGPRPSPARSAGRSPASRCGCVDEAGERRRRTTTPARSVVRGDNLFSGYWPDGSGGPDARRLVGHRRRRVRRRGRRPVPGRPAQGAGAGQRLQRLPARGRGRARPSTPTSLRSRSIGVPHPYDRRGGQGVRRGAARRRP